MAVELLRARQLELSTKDLLRLVYDRHIHFVMVGGFAHIPADALDEYRARSS